MIIYESNVEYFKNISNDPRKMAAEISANLRDKFGIRVADNEMRSWMASLPCVSKLIDKVVGDKRKILIEFNIPTSKKRIDFILLGKNKKAIPSAWILELKQWSKITEEEWNEFRVGKYKDSHPSYQAAQYQELLEDHMNLIKSVDIKSGAFLHNLKDKDSVLYSKTYNEALEKAVLYSFHDQKELKDKMEEHTFIKDGLEAMEYFKSAKWAPSKRFKEMIKKDFENMSLSPSQQLIFDKIEKFIKKYRKKEKVTFMISGDPGSGKTIVAFKLMMLLTKDSNLQTQLMIPGQEVRNAFRYQLREMKLVGMISGSNVWRGYDAAIIDEAHKAIGRDTGKVNYSRMYDHLNFAIILIDNDQVINKKGMSKEEIEKIAIEKGHKVYTYEIEENFRNYGERVLIDWIDNKFYNRKITSDGHEYVQDKYINRNLNYKLRGYTNDQAFVNEYYEVLAKNNNTRITSLWHRQFYIGPADENGEVPRTINIGKNKFAWNPNAEWWNRQTINDKKTYNSKVKNYADDRKQFLIGAPNPEYMAYFNHIQGYEFDHIFVYIPNIFTYENKEIIFHRERLAKEVMKSQTWAPTSKIKWSNNKDPYTLNKKYFLNRLKVMLTRGTKSTHVFAIDKNLNEYLLKSID